MDNVAACNAMVPPGKVCTVDAGIIAVSPLLLRAVDVQLCLLLPQQVFEATEPLIGIIANLRQGAAARGGHTNYTESNRLILVGWGNEADE